MVLSAPIICAAMSYNDPTGKRGRQGGKGRTAHDKLGKEAMQRTRQTATSLINDVRQPRREKITPNMRGVTLITPVHLGHEEKTAGFVVDHRRY